MGAMLPNDYKNVNVTLRKRYGLVKRGERAKWRSGRHAALPELAKKVRL
jgi:hypothetical protein